MTEGIQSNLGKTSLNSKPRNSEVSTLSCDSVTKLHQTYHSGEKVRCQRASRDLRNSLATLAARVL